METTYAEQIIKKIKEVESGEKEDYFNVENDINKGYIIVKYQKLALEEKEVMDGKLKMCLPKNFELMPEELVSIKYPDEDGPEYIYSDESSTVNITFSLEEGEVDSSEVEEIRDITIKEIKRLYPDSPIEDKALLQTEVGTISTFSFQVPLVDDEIYNLMFFMALSEGLLVGGFNCSGYDKKEWQPVVMQLLTTIKIVEA